MMRWDYPWARINSHQIDYLIVARKESRQVGLFVEEITESVATLHVDRAKGDLDCYRRDLSDHFPITACVAVNEDTD